MHINIQLQCINDTCIFPVHYNEILQGFIYHHLERTIASRVHDRGWRDANRYLKLFTFSRLRGEFRRQGNTLHFSGPLSLRIASPVDAFLESLAIHLMREHIVRIGQERFELISIEVLTPPAYRQPVLLKALSPITVYSTLTAADGRKKTYYYAPGEPEFGRHVLANLRRKIRAWTGEDLPEEEATFRPMKVSNRNLVVARYKGTIIKGWTGIYELNAPEPYFRMALDAGLGAKNSQGFGCVEVWEAHPKRGS